MNSWQHYLDTLIQLCLKDSSLCEVKELLF